MKTWECAKREQGAFTLVETLVVMAIIGILAALLLPAIAQTKARARRVQCLSNLRQTGIAFHLFMHDHDNRFPMQVSTNEGGTMEFVQNSYRVPGEFYFQYRHFQPLSNDLQSTRLLVCPADTARFVAENFEELRNTNISYFVGVTADYAQPDSILAGDRNLRGRQGGPTLVRFHSGDEVKWTSELHGFKGNVLCADGRVTQLNDLWLKFADRGAPPDGDLVLPTVARAAVSWPSAPSSPARDSSDREMRPRATMVSATPLNAQPSSVADSSPESAPKAVVVAAEQHGLKPGIKLFIAGWLLVVGALAYMLFASNRRKRIRVSLPPRRYRVNG